MKTRFNTYDIVCSVAELQRFLHMRVNNIYDIDNKTYLIKLEQPDQKSVILFESGNRIHSTSFEWPKNVAPSGFSMKMRKHLRNKRLESLEQLGRDRIVDMKFGSGEAAYHVILELFDRGNVVLTDHELTILYVLRPHTEGDRFKFAVREKYPLDRVRKQEVPSIEGIKIILEGAKKGDQLKKVILPHLEYGPALTEHVLLKVGFLNSTKIGNGFDIEQDIQKLYEAILEAENILIEAKTLPTKGYITQKREERPSTKENGETEYFYSNQEFHPLLYRQHANAPHRLYETFNAAVDEFFSTAESQKIELRAFQQEKEAMKKLENVRKDHYQRLEALEKTQEVDKQKAELITRNQQLVDNAILAIQSILANQTSWIDIATLIKEAASNGDPVAKQIKQLKLETNHISLLLSDPYEDGDLPAMVIDVDLDVTAFANARRYYDMKRTAAKKQQKTIESQSKALKSAEKKTKQTLKEMQTITSINKARKVYWFEKFFWFISSENYLVIAGRDQMQNELIVKRYMKPQDVYVHADIHGASSVVIINPSNQPVPPKTLNEAGTMAICYSVAWDAKVVTNAYWVMGEQVSKTAPTGEYLTTGSFMIRGKKNFLPPSHLILGLSFMFRLEDGSIERHLGERKIITTTDDDLNFEIEESKNDIELEVLDESDEEQNEEKTVEIEEEDKLNEDEEEKIASETSDSEKESEDIPKFPDTQIKTQYFSGTRINILTRPLINPINEENEEEGIVYLGDDKPIVLKHSNRQRNNSETKKQKNAPKKEEKDEYNKQPSAKRGQKSKLKKIKEKYKDQDEEERNLRMHILQSAGQGKETKKNKKNKEETGKSKQKVPRQPMKPSQRIDNEEGIEEKASVQVDVDMIDALTGIPLPEDELLFAVPVVAPYNTLSNYKFKVKLTPGSNKRGKAAKTAVGMFLHDRVTSQREKDLLKAVKDEQLARNIPGKVKLSAPRLQTLKK